MNIRKYQCRGGVCPPRYIYGYLSGRIRAGKPCPYKLFGEMRTFIKNSKQVSYNSSAFLSNVFCFLPIFSSIKKAAISPMPPPINTLAP